MFHIIPQCLIVMVAVGESGSPCDDPVDPLLEMVPSLRVVDLTRLAEQCERKFQPSLEDVYYSEEVNADPSMEGSTGFPSDRLENRSSTARSKGSFVASNSGIMDVSSRQFNSYKIRILSIADRPLENLISGIIQRCVFVHSANRTRLGATSQPG